MLSSLVWIVLLVLVAVALAVLKGKAGGIGAGAFLGVLDQAVGPEHRVFGKVRLADVASIDSGLRAGARQSAFNRISAKHFDFLVCRSGDLAPVCAIELNDRSHGSLNAQAQDAVKIGVCQPSGCHRLSVPAKRAYTVQEVRARFQVVVSQ